MSAVKKWVLSIVLTAGMVTGMIQMADAGVINITNQELSTLLRKGAALIDIRTELEWKQTGIIPGSHLLTLFDEQRRVVDPDSWLAKVKTIVPLDKPVILICRIGNRTIPATQFLSRSGYKQVYNVTGGIVPWIKAGLPVERYRQNH